MDTLALLSQGGWGSCEASGNRQGPFLLPSTGVPAPSTAITELAWPCSPPCWGISHPMDTWQLLSLGWSRKGFEHLQGWVIPAFQPGVQHG